MDVKLVALEIDFLYEAPFADFATKWLFSLRDENWFLDSKL